MSLIDKEIWKKIKGFPKYEISSFGNIRNKKTVRYLATFVSFGRNCVQLRDKDSNITTCYIDNLVAYTFLPIPYGIVEPKIYHKNKDYLDDRLVNLHFRKNVQTNAVLVNIYLFKKGKCYLRTTLSFHRAKQYLNCTQGELNYALVHTSVIKNDGKEYKVEYNFNKI